MQQAFDEGQQVEPASEKPDQRYGRKAEILLRSGSADSIRA